MAKSYADYLYKADKTGDSYSIRLEAATAAAQTTAPTPTATTDPTRQGSARVSGSVRQFGIRARYFTLVRTVTAGTGTGAVTRKYYTRFPVPDKADFDAASKGTTVTISGVAWQVSSKTGEDIK